MRTGDDITDSINYNKELFDFLKRIFPNASSCKGCKAQLGFYSKPKSFNRKLKASVIICPICNYHCVEDIDPVLDIFQRHVKKVHKAYLNTELVDSLQATINFLRSYDRIPYIDPFVYVPREALLSK